MARTTEPENKVESVDHLPPPAAVMQSAEFFQALAKFYLQHPDKVRAHRELAEVLVGLNTLASDALKTYASILAKRGTVEATTEITRLLKNAKSQKLSIDQQAMAASEAFGVGVDIFRDDVGERSPLVKSVREIGEPGDEAATVVGNTFERSSSSVKHFATDLRRKKDLTEVLGLLFQSTHQTVRVKLWSLIAKHLKPDKKRLTKQKASLEVARTKMKMRRRDRETGMKRRYPD